MSKGPSKIVKPRQSIGQSKSKLENDAKLELKLKDALDLEANFYLIRCEVLLAQLENNRLKREFIVWFNIFASPILSAQPQDIRVKRNRYLYLMMMSLMNNDIAGFLRMVIKAHEKVDKKPAKVRGLATPTLGEKVTDQHKRPKSIMVACCPTTFQYPEVQIPEWEFEKCWESVLLSVITAETKTNRVLTATIDRKICSIHLDKCPAEERRRSKKTVGAAPEKPLRKIELNLDQQFAFLVSLAIPYIQFLPNSTDNASLWLRALCEIDREACFEMKGIRNDYMKLFAGYLMHNHLVGPFENIPIKPLPALSEAAEVYSDQGPFDKNISMLPLSPLSDSVQQFMNEVPLIDEGAFAFLSLSGSLFGYPAN